MQRLNTFIPEDLFKSLKIFSASRGEKLHQTVSYVLQLGLDNLPASGSRPELPEESRMPSGVGEPGSAGNQSSQEDPFFTMPKAEGQPWSDDPTVAKQLMNEVTPDLIVRCSICGSAIPQSVRELHEQNCQRAKEGYWDRRSFRS